MTKTILLANNELILTCFDEHVRRGQQYSQRRGIWHE